MRYVTVLLLVSLSTLACGQAVAGFEQAQQQDLERKHALQMQRSRAICFGTSKDSSPEQSCTTHTGAASLQGTPSSKVAQLVCKRLTSLTPRSIVSYLVESRAADFCADWRRA